MADLWLKGDTSPILPEPAPYTSDPEANGTGSDVGAAPPLTTLRAGGVEVDARRATQVILRLGLLALALLGVGLFVVGIHKNAQITDLRQHGVPVEMTVTGCLGQLGGSGSNTAGYACRGTYTIDGHRYEEAIPGNVLRAPKTTVRAVADPGKPGLVSTANDVASEHASAKVFVVPTILLVVLVLLLAAFGLRRRAVRRHAP